MNPSSFIKINPADSVVVCLRPFVKGEQIEVDGTTVTLQQDTPMGHKVIIADTAAGTNILKYGYPLGHALVDLKATCARTARWASAMRFGSCLPWAA